MTPERLPARIVDPRAVRVVAIDSGTSLGDDPIVIEPAGIPVAPTRRGAGAGGRGGLDNPNPPLEAVALVAAEPVLVDGVPTTAHLERQDDGHAILVEGDGRDATRTPVLLLPLEPAVGPSSGVARREVVVGGWSIAVEIESERRASLRERARRGREAVGHGGPTEVRAIIPGRVLAVSIVPGDAVVAGQQLLVVEAMKMQNELRAPRDGVVSSVAVGPGRTIEVGDLLLVLQ